MDGLALDTGYDQLAAARQAAAADARERRRTERLDSLAKTRHAVGAAADALSDSLVRRLEDDADEGFVESGRAGLTLTRLARAMRQIVALEDRLDVDEETRIERRREEAAAKAEAERDARAEEEAAAAEQALDRKKKAIRKSVRVALKAYEGENFDSENAERLLDDLFADYERYDDYDGETEDIVTELSGELGILPDEEEEEESEEEASEEDEDAPQASDDDEDGDETGEPGLVDDDPGDEPDDDPDDENLDGSGPWPLQLPAPPKPPPIPRRGRRSSG